MSYSITVFAEVRGDNVYFQVSCQTRQLKFYYKASGSANFTDYSYAITYHNGYAETGSFYEGIEGINDDKIKIERNNETINTTVGEAKANGCHPLSKAKK